MNESGGLGAIQVVYIPAHVHLGAGFGVEIIVQDTGVCACAHVRVCLCVFLVPAITRINQEFHPYLLLLWDFFLGLTQSFISTCVLASWDMVGCHWWASCSSGSRSCHVYPSLQPANLNLIAV